MPEEEKVKRARGRPPSVVGPRVSISATLEQDVYDAMMRIVRKRRYVQRGFVEDAIIAAVQREEALEQR